MRIKIKNLNGIKCTYRTALSFNMMHIDITVPHRKGQESRIMLKDSGIFECHSYLRMCLPSYNKVKKTYKYRYADAYHFSVDTRTFSSEGEVLEMLFGNIDDLFLIPSLDGILNDYCIPDKKQNVELLRVMRKVGY